MESWSDAGERAGSKIGCGVDSCGRMGTDAVIEISKLSDAVEARVSWVAVPVMQTWLVRSLVWVAI